jgi:peroxiredoxin
MRIYLIVAILAVLSSVALGQQDYRLVGKLPAPMMKLNDLSGGKIDTSQFKGKLVVYNLWFVGCPPCMEELNEIVNEFAGSDVEFVGLSTSNAGDINKFIAKTPFRYRLVPSAGKDMLINFGLAGPDGSLNVPFPTHVVVNREGFIEYRATGLKGVEGIREILRRETTPK